MKKGSVSQFLQWFDIFKATFFYLSSVKIVKEDVTLEIDLLCLDTKGLVGIEIAAAVEMADHISSLSKQITDKQCEPSIVVGCDRPLDSPLSDHFHVNTCQHCEI